MHSWVCFNICIRVHGKSQLVKSWKFLYSQKCTFTAHMLCITCKGGKETKEQLFPRSLRKSTQDEQSLALFNKPPTSEEQCKLHKHRVTKP